MNISNNTILITGGGSGIGRALAEAFHAQGNQVIIAGRRLNVLKAVTAANPGMQAITLDIENPEAITQFAAQVRQAFPSLNAIIHNAGIMRPEVLDQGNSEIAEATIATNLLGPIRLNAALLEHLLQQENATVLTVTSGLGFVPLAAFPTYSASKAALHTYTQTLRHQLQHTSIQVIELIPPYVQTELTGKHQATDPNAMPLADYINQTMHLLETQPNATEIIVERVKPLRFAAATGNFDAMFTRMNGAITH